MTTRKARSSWGFAAPSRKWFVALAIGLGAVGTSAADSGWDAKEWKLLIALAVQMAVTYFVPNGEAQDG